MLKSLLMKPTLAATLHNPNDEMLPYAVKTMTFQKKSFLKLSIVPEILLSGNHAKIEKWRNKKAIESTKKKRPDLVKETEV